MSPRKAKKVTEIAIIDDLEKCEKDVLDALIGLRDGSRCRLIINSGGGSVYAGLGIATLVEMKRLKATAVVLADCSSSALLVFSSCQERLVAPHASFLFHPMQWSSEERSRLPGALGWAREFKRIEGECSTWMASRLGVPESVLAKWVKRETYVTSRELVDLGVAKFIPHLAHGTTKSATILHRRGPKSPRVRSRSRARILPAAGHKRSRQR